MVTSVTTVQLQLGNFTLTSYFFILATRGWKSPFVLCSDLVSLIFHLMVMFGEFMEHIPSIMRQIFFLILFFVFSSFCGISTSILERHLFMCDIYFLYRPLINEKNKKASYKLQQWRETFHGLSPCFPLKLLRTNVNIIIMKVY